MKAPIQTARLLAELDHLATLTTCPQTPDPALPSPQRAVTRIVFTAQDLAAREWFKALATQAGFTLREDAIGNTFVRWHGRNPDLAPVGTGSHIDAIPFAGMYDGTVGVLGALEAMRSLQESGFVPQRSIELILFTSEEPTRFGIGCLGSRLLGGVLDPATADALPDRLHETDTTTPAGGTLQSARTAAGFTGSLASVPLTPGAYSAWVELHIEQGPLLERTGDHLGIVTHIAGPASYRFTVEGLGGHAGALLMPDRRDALCAASEMVLAIERLVNEANQADNANDLVGTVGKLDIYPGAVNAVPSRVTFTLDLRDTDLTRRERTAEAIQTTAVTIARTRDVRLAIETTNADAPTACDPSLVALLERCARKAGARTRRMVSRAYHDTTFMARIAPVTMLFIPCRNGVSHRPDEYASPEAIARGAEVLAASLAELAGAATPPQGSA